MAGAPSEAVAPLGTWEEPDNLGKGSVVLRGVVIGGKKMQQVGGARARNAPAAAPAKAKQPPAAASVQANIAPAAAAPAKAKAGRRLLEKQ